MINVAFIGYGRNADELHAPAIEAVDSFQVTGVFDVSADARLRAHQRFGCRMFETYEEALTADNLDLVVILTRSDLHAKMACDFLRAGKNVLVTKPWALDCKQADQMLLAAKESGRTLMPWLPCRWSSDLKKLKELLASGVIGSVFQVRRSFLTFGKRSDWQTMKQFGGGYLLNWGPHLIDQPIELIGEPVTQVYGEMKQIINPGDAEDMFYAVMKTKSGVLLVSEFNIGESDLPDWFIQGDRGTISVKGDRIEISVASHPNAIDPKAYRGDVQIKKTVLNENSSENIYGDAIAIYTHIGDVLLMGKSYVVSLESAYALTRVLDAVRQSAASAQVVHIR